MPPSPPTAIPDKAAILDALDAVTDPKSGRGLAAAGLVRGLVLRPGRAGFMLEVAAEDAALYAAVRTAAEAALAAVPGVGEAQVVLTAANPTPGQTGAPTPAALQGRRPPAPPTPVPHVRRIIAVASGKGGVGKSTVAVNLAAAFAAMGWRTGLLDADVYGPSVPQMLGLSEKPEMNGERKLKPLRAFGLRAVSIGLLVQEGAPVIWRGPMASTALTQLLHDVAWGSADEPLDLLVIDLPPGTGDVQLTLTQKVRLDGAVIVSTPQAVALIDVRRGAAMFGKTKTPILGVIENMAYFPDPVTGAPIEIFGRGGARAVATEIGAPFLGELSIDIALRQSGDAGVPIIVAAPDGATAQAFRALAATLRSRLEP